MSSVAGRRLPPAQVDCMWWKQGYCARGKTCHFRHDEAMAGVDNKKPDAETRGNGKGKAKAKINSHSDSTNTTDGPSTPDPATASSPTSTQICTICLETPDTFGLLANCDHVFCLECIRNWRSSTTAPLPSNDELKSTSKTCPMCRSHSDFIIPSSLFPSPPSTDGTPGAENTVKKEIVDRYLSRLASIPCRYFKKSIDDSCTSFGFRPRCRFGNSCHYAHIHPITKKPYIFSEEELNRPRRRPRRNRAQFAEEMALMERIFADLGTGFDSEDEWGCEDENDLAFFESGSVGGFFESGFESGDLGFSLDLDWDELEHNYGWD